MMKIAIISCFVIAVISLFFNFKLSQKIKHLSGHRSHGEKNDDLLGTSDKVLKLKNRLDQVINDLNGKVFPNVNSRIRDCEVRIKALNDKINAIQVSLVNNTKENAAKVESSTTESGQKSSLASAAPETNRPQENKSPDKPIENGKKDKRDKIEPKQPVGKSIYLELNSDDYFFDYSDQKSGTSKFIAYLTSENEAAFEPIDVERVRSANVSASLKQSGSVPIKDAQSFKVISKGKIKKESNGDWHIESPVVVEFIK